MLVPLALQPDQAMRHPRRDSEPVANVLVEATECQLSPECFFAENPERSSQEGGCLTFLPKRHNEAPVKLPWGVLLARGFDPGLALGGLPRLLALGAHVCRVLILMARPPILPAFLGEHRHASTEVEHPRH